MCKVCRTFLLVLLALCLSCCVAQVYDKKKHSTQLGPITAEEKQYILQQHNKYRRRVRRGKLPDLKYDNKLGQKAQKWADSCKYWHRVENWGENIAYDDDNAPGTKKEAIEHALKMWMVEEKFNKDGKFTCCTRKSLTCCHFTQVIWKNTKRVGCGFNRCRNMEGSIYVVCYYYPPGNMQGEKPY